MRKRVAISACLCFGTAALCARVANAQIAKSPNNANFYDLLGTALFNGKKDLPGAEAALFELAAFNSHTIV